jgi:hypothetical protein
MDFETDKNYNFDDIIIDDKIIISNESNKYLIFYDKCNAYELYLKIPRVRLTFDWNNIKYNSIKLRITPKYSKIDNFIKFILDFENYIINCKNIKKKNLEFMSILEKERGIYYLKTFLNENKVLITTDLNTKIKFTDFKNNGEIQIILKICGVWQKNNKYGLSTNIYQIKYYAPPEDHNKDMLEINIPVIENKVNKNNNNSNNSNNNNNSNNSNNSNNNNNNTSNETVKSLNIYPAQLFKLDKQMLESIKLKHVEAKN